MSAATRQALRQACQAALPWIEHRHPHHHHPHSQSESTPHTRIESRTPHPSNLSARPAVTIPGSHLPPPGPLEGPTAIIYGANGQTWSIPSIAWETYSSAIRCESLPLWDGPALDGQRAFVQMAINPAHYERIRTEYLHSDDDRRLWSLISDSVRDRQDLHRIYVGAASRTRILVEQARQSRLHHLLLQYASDRSAEWFSQQPAGTPPPPTTAPPPSDCPAPTQIPTTPAPRSTTPNSYSGALRTPGGGESSSRPNQAGNSKPAPSDSSIAPTAIKKPTAPSKSKLSPPLPRKPTPYAKNKPTILSKPVKPIEIPICYKCERENPVPGAEIGHWANDCPLTVCPVCNKSKPGHYRYSCPEYVCIVCDKLEPETPRNKMPSYGSQRKRRS